MMLDTIYDDYKHEGASRKPIQGNPVRNGTSPFET